MATAVAPVSTENATQPTRTSRPRRNGWVFHAVMGPLAFLWIAPMIFVAFVAIRPFDDIIMRGLGALPTSVSWEGFSTAMGDGSIQRALVNSALVTIPSVVLTLWLASMAAFALSRFNIPFRRVILLAMLAGNLLPPQVLLIPVARITESLGIYDTLTGLVVVHVGFGLGFYTFVLHGFMRGIPREVTEAAVVDGASPSHIYWRIIIPLTRPALAALAALATTWIFNDLIWALTVLRSEDKFPITAALLNFQGAYLSNWNVVAAGSLVAAIPTAVVFFAFQRHFVSGLLVGSTK